MTLKTAAAQVADREEALEAAVRREKDLIRHRHLQAESTRATEAGYHEKIERLRRAQAATQEALDAANARCEQLTQELAALRIAPLFQDAETALIQREENEILRQKINEIGAAVIRATGGSNDAAPGQEQQENELTGNAVPQKATV